MSSSQYRIGCRRLVLLACGLLSMSVNPRHVMGQAVAERIAPVDVAALEIPKTDDGLPGEGPIRRMDWFQKLWISRRTEWAQRKGVDSEAVILLGDSITQGWGDDFSQIFPGMKVANRGISGDTTRGMLIRLHQDVLSLDPKGIVLLMGTNDLEEGADPATIAENLRLIVAAIRADDPQVPIVLCSVFPSTEKLKRPQDKIKEVNRLFAEVVQGEPKITVLDTWTLFANEQGDAKSDEFPDLLHPNEAGYAKWAGALRPILNTIGLLPIEKDSFTVEPGFESLFNGRDLTGWGYRPSTEEDKQAAANWRKSDPKSPPWPIVTKEVSFEGQQATPDGRYLAHQGRLVVTTPTEGRKIQQIWTTGEFSGDFVLRLEFRATPNADSGIFIRKPQLQCRDFGLAGPYKDLQSYRPLDWNAVEIVVQGGKAKYTCNGEELEAGVAVPSSGPIGLEGDRGQIEYRRLRWKPLSNGESK